MFKSTQNKGFQMTFKNGLTVSVQFGYGNYCENRNYNKRYAQELEKEIFSCNNAEIAVWNEQGTFITEQFTDEGDGSIAGWLNTNEVADIIQKVKNVR